MNAQRGLVDGKRHDLVLPRSWLTSTALLTDVTIKELVSSPRM